MVNGPLVATADRRGRGPGAIIVVHGGDRVTGDDGPTPPTKGVPTMENLPGDPALR